MPPVAEERLRRIFDEGGGRCHRCHKAIHFKNYRRRGSRGAWAVNRSGNLPPADGDPVRPLCLACLGDGAAAHPPRAEPARAGGPIRSAAEPGRGGPRVLLVDDDHETLALTAEVLSAAGATVVMAFSGGEAVARVRLGERFDVVIADFRMPGMTGFDVAERIAALAPGTPVHMLTGWERDIPQEDPRRKLVASILAKPFEIAELQRLLDAAAAAPRPSRPRIA